MAGLLGSKSPYTSKGKGLLSTAKKQKEQKRIDTFKGSLQTTPQQAVNSVQDRLGITLPNTQVKPVSSMPAEEAEPQGRYEKTTSVKERRNEAKAASNPQEPEKKGVFRWIGDNLMAGLGSFNKNFYNAIQSIGGDKVPGVQDVLKFGEDVAKQDISKGGTDLGSQFVQAVPGAVANLGLALMTGGASAPAQLGGNTALQAAKGIVTSPTFVNSFIQGYGGAYGEAREAGQDRGAAITSAILQAVPTAVIEQAGGIEQLPAKAAKQGLLKTIGRTALEEAGEELLQYPIGGAVKKATYKPETPIFSTAEEAVINPLEMGKSALIGGAMGGLMGGVGKIASGRSGVNFTQEQAKDFIPVEQNTEAAATQETPEVTPATRNVQAELEAALNENSDEVVRLYKQQAQQELEAAQEVYNRTIEDIQNEYMTNQLRVDEAEEARQKYNLDDIVSRIEEAENKLQKTPEQIKSEVRVGLGTGQQYELLEMKRQPVFSQPDAAGYSPIGGNMAADMMESATLKVEPQPQPQQTRAFGEPEIPNGMKERGVNRNIRTDKNSPDSLRQAVTDTPLTYQQKSNVKTLSKAEAIMAEGYESARLKLDEMLNNMDTEAAPLAVMLARESANRGDTNGAKQIIAYAAEKATQAGQFGQAFRILRDSDPASLLMSMQNQLKKLNQDGQKQYGKKWTDVELTDGEIQLIMNTPLQSEAELKELQKIIGQRIAKELPSSGMEKFDAWRRIAMLFNPRTHVRNIGGNFLMSGMQATSDFIGAGIEGIFLPKEQRTKSFGWKSDSSLVQKVNEAWKADKETLTNQSRYEIDNLKSLGQEKRIFKSNALQGLNDITMQGLNLGDIPFVKAAYTNSLGQFMKARGLTEVTQEARDYAARRAMEATFKETNEMATIINRLKQKPVVGKIIEGAIPFSKTPANITMRAIEYSPAGILKALYDIKAGKGATKVIEDLAKGLTGTGLLALGMWLSKIGWIKVERNRSDKAEGLLQEAGEQPYSVITPLGSYTFDWAQPFAVPLAMGVSVEESLSKQKDGGSLVDALLEGLYAGGDTIFNMTMLRNIKEIFGSGGSPTKKILGIPVAYVEQAIPTIFGQAARTIDPVRRSTYDPDPAKQEWNKIKSRIPFASKTLEPYLNIWGEEQQQGGILEQLFSPGYWKGNNDDSVTQEVLRLYDSFKDNDMLPKVAPASFSNDNVTYTLTAEQRTDFMRDMGQENYDDIKRLISSAEYKRLAEEQKVKKISKIVKDNYDDAKDDIIKASALKGN